MQTKQEQGTMASTCWDTNNSDKQREDDEDIILAHSYRLSLSKPRQSSFRVVAVIFYELHSASTSTSTAEHHQQHERNNEQPTTRKRLHVVGSNDEPCYIGGSICAERAALVQLRFIPNLKRITKIVISTDATLPLHPGMLCREFLSSHTAIDPQTLQILMVGSICNSCLLDITSTQSHEKKEHNEIISYCCSKQETHQWDIVRNRLCDIYPHPSIYNRITAAEASKLGKQYKKQDFQKKTTTSTRTILLSNSDNGIVKRSLSDQELELVQLATNEAIENNNRDTLHPIQYAAAILFQDGTTYKACQRKALEYGCSLDAVTQLGAYIEQKRKDNVNPAILVQADQFGVLHPPFATARAYLSEYGFGDCKVLIMVQQAFVQSNSESELEIVETTIKELSPNVPDMGALYN
mmetsp:Transcript_7735/g.8851  ORF Transcript_7735/g.8851 Transcript_7735/m.8851 type:complete len:409 (+) Transcript_7735:79-1305(+)